ncbi:MAG: biliverdin-producing heme oxygenase [Desulfomonilaceae bacterium]
MVNGFMQRLRESIMPLHDEAEKMGPLHAIADGTIKLDEYIRVLERLYGFVRIAEKAIEDQMDHRCVALDYLNRKRANHLINDLTFLGRSRGFIQHLSCFDSSSRLTRLPDALGYLYLFEGSRLGGLVLSKALKEHFRFQDFRGYSYFGSNGADVPEMWGSFKDFMENYVDKYGEGDEIIRAAKKGFTLLNEWLAKV